MLPVVGFQIVTNAVTAWYGEWMPRALTAVSLCALLSGCYTYVPLDSASPAAGSNIRARLSAPAAARINPSLGNGDSRELSGIVLDAQNHGLTLEVPSVPMGTATAQQGLVQRVTLAPTDIIELEGRTLDKQKTAFVIGAAVVGAGMVTAAIIHGQSTGASTTSEPPSNFTRRLGFSIRF